MIAILQFGGSNCDLDVKKALDKIDIDSKLVWYKDSLKGFDGVILPGGFSYGDYLRAGAIAANTPIMDDVKEIAKKGKPVLGICNGAQILCESGIVPGAYAPNISSRFQCERVKLRVENSNTPFTRYFDEGDIIDMPIAHAEGRYISEDKNIKPLFRYVDKNGEATEDSNPNGSIQNLAGILGEQNNIASMMPHPERATDTYLGSEDGIKLLRSMTASIN